MKKQKQMRNRKAFCLLASFLVSTVLFVVLFTLDMLFVRYMVNNYHADLIGITFLTAIVTTPIVLMIASKVLKVSFSALYRALIVK